MNKKTFLGIVACLVLIAIAVFGFIAYRNSNKTEKSVEPSNAQVQSNATEEIKPEEPEKVSAPQYSLTDPNSIWVIANKTRPLPKGYAPTDLSQPSVAVNAQKSGEENTIRQIVQPSLQNMFNAASAAGLSLFMASGYRSEALQTTYYNSYVASDGEAAANRYSAKPGTSEHQTGLALDISAKNRTCYLDQCFANTPEGKWLAANAYKYGFVLRYQDGKEAETGYMFEPWHFRYVGPELAKTLYESNETLEKHFNLL